MCCLARFLLSYTLESLSNNARKTKWYCVINERTLAPYRSNIDAFTCEICHRKILDWNVSRVKHNSYVQNIHDNKSFVLKTETTPFTTHHMPSYILTWLTDFTVQCKIYAMQKITYLTPYPNPAYSYVWNLESINTSCFYSCKLFKCMSICELFFIVISRKLYFLLPTTIDNVIIVHSHPTPFKFMCASIIIYLLRFHVSSVIIFDNLDKS